MINSRSFISSLLCCLIIGVVGCTASTNSEKLEIEMPAEWSTLIFSEEKFCTSIDHGFLNLGVRKVSKDFPLQEVRLDATLGHTFPTNNIPKLIYFSAGKVENILNIMFGEPVNVGISEAIKCSNGWFYFDNEQVDKYVGDGTTLDYSSRRVEFRLASDGSLLVHVMAKAQFSSLIFHKSQVIEEYWSKFDQRSVN